MVPNVLSFASKTQMMHLVASNELSSRGTESDTESIFCDNASEAADQGSIMQLRISTALKIYKYRTSQNSGLGHFEQFRIPNMFEI